ncbi:protein decapping 5-like isoform X2 [Momordica charantia]|uniref:Protein decapping 5-like isoform X2 n=1 Tax=Momordica charantia TaxID=3673 RepID=A0A6J1C9M0_MOMCH|nr:protein decapping 5-like isoform X2 [Momordica charantia]
MAAESGSGLSSSNPVGSYIGSSISLISMCEIRYEGTLYHLNIQESTIGLKNVRSYGTEGRQIDGPQILPSDKVYDYIVFRGSDIKDLQLKAPSLAETDQRVHGGSAIQSNHAGLLTSSLPASLEGETYSASKQCQDTLSSNGQYPSMLSSYQSVAAAMTSTSSFPPIWQEIGNTRAQVSGKPIFHPATNLSRQSVLNTAPSLSGSGPLPALPPSSLTPYQLSQSGAGVHSSTKKLCVDARNFGASAHLPCNPSALIAVLERQLPSLPSLRETPAQQFTEEFDFQAMNEKFKKDEVWGYLGKAQQMDISEVAADNAIGIVLGDKERRWAIPTAKPAYNKNEFFDTISCNSLERGSRNGHNRFSGPNKFDAETSGAGDLPQTGNLGFDGYGYGVRRGENFWGSNNNFGRGYNYGGRGLEGWESMPF